MASQSNSDYRRGEVIVLQLQPITYIEACNFIKLHHRHHLPPQGWKFGIAVNSDGVVVGVITIGRPVARHYDDGWTLEVTRCATDGTKNAPSMLYGAARRAAPYNMDGAFFVPSVAHLVTSRVHPSS